MNSTKPSGSSIERPHQQTFCILGLPRSGTTWLVDLLDQHPRVHCSNDILTSDPFVHGVPMADVTGGQASHLGFKMLEWQNSWWFSALMSRPNVPVILLWRENPIRHLYSITAAGRSGIYHDKPIGRQLVDRIRHGTRALAMREFRYVGFTARTIFRICLSTLLGRAQYHPERLSIPPADLDRHLDATRRRIHGLRDALEARGGPWLEVRYEQLAGPSHGDTMLSILEFLGLPPTELNSSVRRLNGRPLRELLLNHDELEEHCREHGIPFE